PRDAQVTRVLVAEREQDEDCAGLSHCQGPTSVCFESQKEVSTRWNYVGEGRGGYQVVHDFSYVGDHLGSFNPEMAVAYSGYRPRLWFVCSLAVIAVLAVSWAVVMVEKAGGGGGQRDTVSSSGRSRDMKVSSSGGSWPARFECDWSS
ncbi:unnamed protein product, partial [Polarella glacialis]